jgi:NAD(P)-dependent dehydrogenase (short-subunit alcohol dehydrogenase family)
VATGSLLDPYWRMPAPLTTSVIGSYNASEYAVEGFSHALRCELMPFGIPVDIIGPAACEWRPGPRRRVLPPFGSAHRSLIEVAVREQP